MGTAISNRSTLKELEHKMTTATSYKEWKSLALEHDELSGRADWKTVEKSKSYDYNNIRSRLKALRDLRARKDDVGLLFALNEGIHGNQGGMGKTTLYERAKFGTKRLIEDYVNEIVDALEHISALPESESITHEDKIDFFERASLCFGRTALMLSGAGSLGHYHRGVLKTLWEHDQLPNVISGSSAGSIFASVVGTHSDDELEAIFSGEVLNNTALAADPNAEQRTFIRRQVDTAGVKMALEAVIPDMTFQEAYEKTGRMISVTIAPYEEHQTSRLMNAITSPNVYVRSAVMASCAVPGVFPPVMLMAKNVYGEPQPYLPNRRWVDGAVTDDLPAKRLARLYGVNHYIVSQANPLALALMNEQYIPLPEPLKNIMKFSAHEWLKAGEKMSRRYLRQVPDVGQAMSMFYSVMAQDYTGDINIVPHFNIVDPQKLLAQLTIEEMDELALEGERATWSRLEQIKTCSKIGRTLDRIMDHHEAHNVKRFYKKRRKQSS